MEAETPTEPSSSAPLVPSSSTSIEIKNGKTRKNGQRSDEKEAEEKSTFGFWNLITTTTTGNKWLLLLGLILAFITAVADPLMLLLYGQTSGALIQFNNATQRQAAPNSSIVATNKLSKSLDTLSLQFFLLTLVKSLFEFVAAVTVAIPSIKIANDLRKHFLNHIVRADHDFHEGQKTGELSAMFHDHMERILEAISIYFYQLIQMITMGIMTFVFAFAMAWKETLCSLILWPIIICFAVCAMNVVVSSIEEEQLWFGKLATLVDQTFSSIRTVISFNGQKVTLEKCRDFLANAMKASARRSFSEGFMSGIGQFGAAATVALSFIFGVIFLNQDDAASRGHLYTIGLCLMTFGMVMFIIVIPINSLMGAKANLTTIGAVLYEKTGIDSLSQSGDEFPDAANCSIRFRNVNFSYRSRPDIEVLKDISFEVQPGEHVAFVGGSGAGKSTIANLLLRFYDPHEGAVLINGRQLASYNVASWRKRIGYVQQGAALFDATIKENIKYGNLEATEEEIKAAAASAGALTFVQDMPEGFDTSVGDRGSKLSGGQRQRLAIARAIIRHPVLFVFDEATSALDAETEQEVTREMDKLIKGKTSVSIAHRLSTIRNCDRIYVMEKGSIVEVGTHQELIGKQGHYYRMVQLQDLVKMKRQTSLGARKFSRQQSVGGYGSTETDESDLDGELAAGDLVDVRKRERKFTRKMSRALSTDTEAISGRGQGIMRGVSTRFGMAATRPTSTIHKPQRADGDPGPGGTPVLERAADVPIPTKERLSVFVETPFNRRKWLNLAWAVICSVVFAVADTFSSFAFGFMLTFLSLPFDQMKAGVVVISLIWIVMNAICGLANTFFVYAHNRFGDELTSSLRMKLMKQLLRHNLPFFDQPQHSVGDLSAVMVKDTSKLRKVINQDLMPFPSTLASIIMRMSLSMYFNPYYSLLCLVTVPLDVLLYMTSVWVSLRWQTKVNPLQNEAGKISTEAIDSLPTIQAYSLEKLFSDKYADKLRAVQRVYIKQSMVSALIQALLASTAPLYSAYWLKLAEYFIRHQGANAQELWIVMFLIMDVTGQLSLILAQAQDTVRAYVGTKAIAALLVYPVEVDNISDEGVIKAVEGDIGATEVEFSYPTRADDPVLRSLSLRVAKGDTLALVGTSGSGKSTIIHLLQRLYEPNKGKLVLDNLDLKEYNIRYLRQCLVPVNQEPVLFDGTIKENLLYGLDAADYTQGQLEDAASMANIHDFITTLPEGYATEVGEKGVQLSGGQKQRVAIARALIRRPKVLLLDEATSALDTESEKLVQMALETAAEHSTCIVIAHRLSTVKNASQILVLDNGEIVETGTHKTLFAQKGLYYEMCMKQMVD